MKRHMTRREFLGQTSCAAVGSLGLLSTLLNLRMANAAIADSPPASAEDFRALVCLYFGGGMDSYNLLVPLGAEAHALYSATRGGIYDAITNADGLGLPTHSLLPLASHPTDPFAFGTHRKCADHIPAPGIVHRGISSLYSTGQAAFVANVGTLAERITRSSYNNSSGRRPLGLYSHSDQTEQWHTSVCTSRDSLGWAGRAADLLRAGNGSSLVSMNISLSGNNLWQTGSTVFNYNIGTSGATLPSDYNSPLETPVVGVSSRRALRTAGYDNLLQQEYSNLLESTFSTNLKQSIEASAEFKDGFDAVTLATLFPGDAGYIPPAPYTTANDPAANLGRQMKALAKTLAMRGQLKVKRQTFFLNYGGWDHHDEVIQTMDTMVDVVNRCVAAFWEALGELGIQSNVTLYTASDFARTLTSNGAGSDHAWGGNAFVVGGSVNGGRVYGNYPELRLDGPEIVTSRGNVIPSIAVDEYFAELALWLGVAPHRLEDVLPNIRSFFTPGPTGPLGMMRM